MAVIWFRHTVSLSGSLRVWVSKFHRHPSWRCDCRLSTCDHKDVIKSYWNMIGVTLWSDLRVLEFPIGGSNQPWIENIGEKEKFQKVPKSKSWSCHIQKLITYHLHYVRYYKESRDDLKYMGGCAIVYMQTLCHFTPGTWVHIGDQGSWNQPPADPEGWLSCLLEFLDESVLSFSWSLVPHHVSSHGFQVPIEHGLTQAIEFPIDFTAL